MNDQEQRLLEYLRRLSEKDRHSLLRFAAFLAGEQKQGDIQAIVEVTETHVAVNEAEDLPQPEYIERPENERVVDALKRLSKVYPMLDKKPLLDKASSIVAQHVMFGKPAKNAIDEIEALFQEAYNKFTAEQGKR